MITLDRVKSKFLRTWNDAVFESPLISTSLRFPNRNIIVTYHGIDTTGKNPFNGRHTPLRFFEKQIRFLKKHYTLVPLPEYFKQVSGEKKLCAITFDDGYLNNMTNALPVLEKYDAPTTFFITGVNEIKCDILWADFVNIVSKKCRQDVSIDGEVFTNLNGNYISKETGLNLLLVAKTEKPDYSFKEKIYAAFRPLVDFKSDNSLFEYWKLMTDEQLKKFSQSKVVTIGSHGYYHNNLGSIPTEAACQEISLSKKYLENLIQKEVTSIGYPDGSYSDEVSRYATSIGVIHQTCSERFNKEGDRASIYLKNRAGVYNFDTAANQLLTALNYPL